MHIHGAALCCLHGGWLDGIPDYTHYAVRIHEIPHLHGNAAPGSAKHGADAGFQLTLAAREYYDLHELARRCNDRTLGELPAINRNAAQ